MKELFYIFEREILNENLKDFLGSELFITIYGIQDFKPVLIADISGGVELGEEKLLDN